MGQMERGKNQEVSSSNRIAGWMEKLFIEMEGLEEEFGGVDVRRGGRMSKFKDAPTYLQGIQEKDS